MEPVQSKETVMSIFSDMKEKVDVLLSIQSSILQLLGGNACLQDEAVCAEDIQPECLIEDMQLLSKKIRRAGRYAEDIINALK